MQSGDCQELWSWEVSEEFSGDRGQGSCRALSLVGSDHETLGSGHVRGV